MFVNKKLVCSSYCVETTTFKQDGKQPLICAKTQTEYRAKAPLKRGQVSAYKCNINIVLFC